GSRPIRVALASLRALSLLVILLLAAGPRLVRQPERIEQDWIVVLVDRSASMTVPDVPGDAQRRTREDQLSQTLAAAWPTWSQVSKDRRILWLGFDATAYSLPAAADSLPTLPAPQGRRTMLGQSLDEALRAVAARPVSGIVVLSDGRSFDQPSRATLQRLAAERVPVYTVALGSESTPPDIGIASVDAPAAAFTADIIPVTISLSRAGPANQRWAATLELIDTATGAVLDSRRVESTESAASVTLLAKPAEAGRASWAVRVLPESDDLSRDNNAAPVAIELIERPIRVVYIDGYPRWEQRFIKSLLIRENSIRSSAVLLSADKRFTQEGSEQLEAMPSTPEQWNEVDVLILGDVRAELFSDDQLAQLREHVARNAAGVLWIGGSGATPWSWRGRPLADLLPFTLDSEAADASVKAWNADFLLIPTPAATRLGLFRLGDAAEEPWPPALADPGAGWSSLRWSQRLTPSSLKPTAEVLAAARPIEQASPGESWPLVLTMRFGSGKVAYVATDETWRWRYAQGELLTERLWLPLIRFLARERLARVGKPATLEVSPARLITDQLAQVRLRVFDQALLDARAKDSVSKVRVRRAGAQPSDPPAEIALSPEPGVSGSFVGTLAAREPGDYTAEPLDAALLGLGISTPFEVITSDDELKNPAADHAALARLSRQTGGEVIPVDQLASLPPKLPNRQLRLLGAEEVWTLWDRPLALAIVVILLSLEWAGRKWIRLV
ncbi:MAG: VWA domain-containing protein, partial [Phycisphaerae bacterium]|nr:VWA domain-containing protein [Phycisphaerae bacterium]